MKINYKKYKRIYKICDGLIKQKKNNFLISNNSINIVRENSLQLDPFKKKIIYTNYFEIF